MKSSRRCCKHQWGAERYIHVAGRQRRIGRMSAPSLGPIAGSLTGRTTVAVCWFCWLHGGRPCRRLPRRCGLTRPAACRGVVQGCRGRGCQAGVCTCTGCPGPMERLLGGGLPALQTHAMPTSFPCTHRDAFPVCCTRSDGQHGHGGHARSGPSSRRLTAASRGACAWERCSRQAGTE